MDTHLMIGVAVMVGLIGLAASRDLLQALRAQLRPATVRVTTGGARRMVSSRRDVSHGD
ncbi:MULTISPECIES: hypothetical protein [Paraburkholderia]|uniref:hypothetical protein n=1 Tax=Paraburkholderia TaxID=1822464 RepID=UPI000349686F|nr:MULTISPECIES: hypothetical protein [Paraburkholderia]WEY39806.1 hypothetical protein P2869_05435 [Paraburkholderia sp. SUR17]